MRPRAFALCLALLVASSVDHPVAAGCADYDEFIRCVGGLSTQGDIHDIAISGSVAYLAAWSSGVQVVDLTDPQNPLVVGSVPIPDQTTSIAVSGEYAFCTTSGGDPACERGVLHVIDISEPSNPHLVASESTDECATSVAVSGYRAYVTTWHNESGHKAFQVFDVTDPEHPRFLSALDLPGETAMDVAVSGDYAYIAKYTSLEVVDISDPQYPRIVGSAATNYNANRVTISGSYACVSTTGALMMVDVSDPTAPWVAGSAPIGVGHGVTVSGGRAFVAEEGFGLRVVDISSPEDPDLVGNVELGYGAGGVAVLDRSVLVGGWDRLDIVDITTPYSPPLVGGVDTPGEAQDVAISGDYAFVADGGAGLQVIDITNPEAPSIVGSATIPGSAVAVAVSGERAFVAWRVGYGSPGGLEAIDISDPHHPERIGGVGTPGSANDVAASGGFAFVVDDAEMVGHLHIMEVGPDPRSPVIVASVELPRRASGVAISGSRAFVAGWAWDYPYHTILRVIDVSDPIYPQPMGVVSAGCCYARHLAVSGDFAYVPAARFHVIDVSDPWNPRVAGSGGGGSVSDVAILGTNAYVPKDECLELIDVSDPEVPALVGSTVAGGVGVAISGSLVYVAAAGSGLQVAPIQCEPADLLSSDRASLLSRLQIHPNPATRRVTVSLFLQTRSQVRASIHSVGGQRIRDLHDGILGPGAHDLLWDGRDDAGHEVGAGMYLATVSAAEGRKAARIVVLR